MEEVVMLLAFMEMVRRQHDAQHRHFRFKLHLHHAVDNGRRHEIMTIDAAVDHEGRTDDGCIAPGSGQCLGVKGNFICTRHVEYLYLDAATRLCGQFGDKAFARFVNDVGVPAGLNECDFKGCLVRTALVHRFLTKLESGRTKGRKNDAGRRNPDAHSLSSIRTLTVGSGISPDLLTLKWHANRLPFQALAGLKIAFHTAGGEFHPAPRTSPRTIARARGNYALILNLSSVLRRAHRRFTHLARRIPVRQIL
ncbi:Hypothetical protein BCAN_B0693 [Brucella canis ATCC 23365]|uniref:Uncharacterized protein n=1 Tax=Brucella canis (strain ATCC 23365 / NCTC 10854 / RM-666) TaxID=483179 RepID=A9MBX7_BRUC2|nr:Hypothetical protein BCAN_B0693 [Brucella canis ATCC 23365]